MPRNPFIYRYLGAHGLRDFIYIAVMIAIVILGAVGASQWAAGAERSAQFVLDHQEMRGGFDG